MSDAPKTVGTPIQNAEVFVVDLKRTVNATPQQVFDAWVKPDIRKQWWCAKPDMACTVCQIDAREDGNYRINMIEGDSEYITVGKFLEIDEQRKLVFTWSWEKPDDGVQDTLVTVTIRDLGGGQTEVAVQHEKLPSAKSRDNHSMGWTGCMENLVKQFV